MPVKLVRVFCVDIRIFPEQTRYFEVHLRVIAVKLRTFVVKLRLFVGADTMVSLILLVCRGYLKEELKITLEKNSIFFFRAQF